MREVGDGFSIVDRAEREVVPTRPWVPDEGDTEERLRVERTNDEHGAIMLFLCTVQLVVDIDADRAPPEISRA